MRDTQLLASNTAIVVKDPRCAPELSLVKATTDSLEVQWDSKKHQKKQNAEANEFVVEWCPREEKENEWTSTAIIKGSNGATLSKLAPDAEYSLRGRGRNSAQGLWGVYSAVVTGKTSWVPKFATHVTFANCLSHNTGSRHRFNPYRPSVPPPRGPFLASVTTHCGCSWYRTAGNVGIFKVGICKNNVPKTARKCEIWGHIPLSNLTLKNPNFISIPTLPAVR